MVKERHYWEDWERVMGGSEGEGDGEGVSREGGGEKRGGGGKRTNQQGCREAGRKFWQRRFYSDANFRLHEITSWRGQERGSGGGGRGEGEAVGWVFRRWEALMERVMEDFREGRKGQ